MTGLAFHPFNLIWFVNEISHSQCCRKSHDNKRIKNCSVFFIFFVIQMTARQTMECRLPRYVRINQAGCRSECGVNSPSMRPLTERKRLFLDSRRFVSPHTWDITRNIRTHLLTINNRLACRKKNKCRRQREKKTNEHRNFRVNKNDTPLRFTTFYKANVASGQNIEWKEGSMTNWPHVTAVHNSECMVFCIWTGAHTYIEFLCVNDDTQQQPATQRDTDRKWIKPTIRVCMCICEKRQRTTNIVLFRPTHTQNTTNQFIYLYMRHWPSDGGCYERAQKHTSIYIVLFDLCCA